MMFLVTSPSPKPETPMKHSTLPAIALAALASTFAGAQISTTPTQDEDLLAAALHPAGLTINSVRIVNGVAGQFGTYTSFSLPPVSIHDGIVLSSGDVSSMGPLAEVLDPWYDPASPPPQVNSWMVQDGSSGGTSEFDNYGLKGGNIENFYGCYDVAAIEVEFELDEPSQVKFDFIFGSVEYPYWTSQFTDAFVVFLDGTDPENQVTYDASGSAVQVGSSFAGLETTADVNTAFSAPHGLIHHLTTTTAELDKGTHTLIFEVGDVNDHILDSAAFITRLRTGVGNEGTEPTEDCPADLNGDDVVDGADLGMLLADWGRDADADFNEDDTVDGADLGVLLAAWGPCAS
jgi:hypothetical protein